MTAGGNESEKSPIFTLIVFLWRQKYVAKNKISICHIQSYLYMMPISNYLHRVINKQNIQNSTTPSEGFPATLKETIEEKLSKLQLIYLSNVKAKMYRKYEKNIAFTCNFIITFLLLSS